MNSIDYKANANLSRIIKGLGFKNYGTDFA